MKAEDLKNSILQLAMEGKLVPQNPNDEPASILLERIKDEKERQKEIEREKNREAAEKAAKEEERKRVEEAKAKLAAKAEKRKKK